ncbi:hypothetical protein G6O67_004448 [Ophiocordyceps sinensis]|uniref:DNA/RNA-binding protein Alba-like domain-containing protein n=2 Tax=Ophiocordyceps sinensis TaxID=72228 RepID=A0A8H4M086_9HYPO|nr:hypothetical protein OCS_05768 [Ophiocordyceps sinensis CO18]KAF4508010.1 hypothetical protein G6O67_004448 [Ophiocordyceps sinensis]
MSAPPVDEGREKRKRPADASEPRKKPAGPPRAQRAPSLIGPHEAIVGTLQAKHNVLVASVISSTQIRKRVELAVAHLVVAADGPTEKSRLVLLHARTAQVCKMITVVEQCKRILSAKGKAWCQYNQLFDLPVEPRRPDVVEETVLDKNGGDSDHDDFEVMSSRFEKAVLPAPPTRTVKSMRVFLSRQPISELDNEGAVTIQTSEGPKS